MAIRRVPELTWRRARMLRQQTGLQRCRTRLRTTLSTSPAALSASPSSLSRTTPARSTTKVVGIARTPSRSAMAPPESRSTVRSNEFRARYLRTSPSSSSTLMATTRSASRPSSRWSRASSGSARAHGTHHVAQTSRTTTLPRSASRWSVVPSRRRPSTGPSGASRDGVACAQAVRMATNRARFIACARAASERPVVREREVRHRVLALDAVQGGHRGHLHDGAHEQRVGQARGGAGRGVEDLAAAVLVMAAIRAAVLARRPELRLERDQVTAGLAQGAPRPDGREQRVAVAKAARVGAVHAAGQIGEEGPRPRAVGVRRSEKLVPRAAAELQMLVGSVLAEAAVVGTRRQLERSGQRDDVSRFQPEPEDLRARRHRDVTQARRAVVADSSPVEVLLPEEPRHLSLQDEPRSQRILGAEEQTALAIALRIVPGTRLLAQVTGFHGDAEVFRAGPIQAQRAGGWITAAHGAGKYGSRQERQAKNGKHERTHCGTSTKAFAAAGLTKRSVLLRRAAAACRRRGRAVLGVAAGRLAATRDGVAQGGRAQVRPAGARAKRLPPPDPPCRCSFPEWGFRPPTRGHAYTKGTGTSRSRPGARSSSSRPVRSGSRAPRLTAGPPTARAALQQSGARAAGLAPCCAIGETFHRVPASAVPVFDEIRTARLSIRMPRNSTHSARRAQIAEHRSPFRFGTGAVPKEDGGVRSGTRSRRARSTSPARTTRRARSRAG